MTLVDVKWWAVRLVAFALAVLMAGTVSAGTVFVTDKFGRVVPVEAPVKRAVLLDTYELAASLGVWDKVVGVSRFAFANDLVMATVSDAKTRFADVGTPADVNLEKLIALKPDLVVTWDLNRASVDFMADKGLKVIALRPESFAEVMEAQTLLGRLFGAEAEAARAEAEAQAMIALVRERISSIPIAERRRGLWMVGRQNTVAGRTGVLSSLFDFAGITNVASEVQERTSEISPERILAWNPDLWLVWGYSHVDVNTVLGNPQWAKIKAVGNRQVVRGPRWSTLSPRIAPLVLWLAATAYPQAFADMDVIGHIDAFMRSLYGVSYMRMNPVVSP